MHLRKRIARLEQRQLEQREPKCLCYFNMDGYYVFHTREEAEAAGKVRCPVHGKRNLAAYQVNELEQHIPLPPPDQHLCHCPPNRFRAILEQGHSLTHEERLEAQQEYNAAWSRKAVVLLNNRTP